MLAIPGKVSASYFEVRYFGGASGNERGPMSVSGDEARGAWMVQCWYRDWRGERPRRTRRGFATKSGTKRWGQAFLARCEGGPTMNLSEIYEEDVRPLVKQSTWDTKEHMVRTKILPHLGERPLNEITSADVIRWQNELTALRTPTGERYRATYLHAVSNQLSALLNHAVLHYNLPSNPARKVPKMGAKDACETSVWTKKQIPAVLPRHHGQARLVNDVRTALLDRRPRGRAARAHA